MERTRKAAMDKGEAKYFTGKACLYEHIAPRRTKTGECTICRANKVATWRKNNPEGVKKHNNSQYAKHYSKIKEATKRYYLENKEKIQASISSYRKKNPHIVAKCTAAQKANRLKRIPDWLSKDDRWLIDEVYALARLRTKAFGFQWDVDHIVPLQGKDVSGLHVPWNLQVIPASENRIKSNKVNP